MVLESSFGFIFCCLYLEWFPKGLLEGGVRGLSDRFFPRRVKEGKRQAFAANWDAIIPRSLAIGMKSSQWMEVGCLIGVRLWMNQLG